MTEFYYPPGYTPGYPPKPKAAFRECIGTERGVKAQLARALGVSYQTIMRWLQGDEITASQKALDEYLHLTPDKSLLLMLARFPALDPMWLTKYPIVEEKSGLMLAAYRKREGWEQSDLAKILGLKHRESIANWETGAAPIPTKYYTHFQEIFHLSEKENDAFLKQIVEFRDARRTKSKMARMESTHMGAKLKDTHPTGIRVLREINEREEPTRQRGD